MEGCQKSVCRVSGQPALPWVLAGLIFHRSGGTRWRHCSSSCPEPPVPWGQRPRSPTAQPRDIPLAAHSCLQSSLPAPDILSLPAPELPANGPTHPVGPVCRGLGTPGRVTLSQSTPGEWRPGSTRARGDPRPAFTVLGQHRLFLQLLPPPGQAHAQGQGPRGGGSAGATSLSGG